jgi:hypothetical protein
MAKRYIPKSRPRELTSVAIAKEEQIKRDIAAAEKRRKAKKKIGKAKKAAYK